MTPQDHLTRAQHRLLRLKARMGLDDDDDGSQLTSLPHSERPSYGTLQGWFAADTKTVEAQEDYLRQLQLTPSQRIDDLDRRKLKNWDLSILNTCKEHVEVLLSIPIATFEEERIRRAIGRLAASADVLACNAIELAEKLDEELGPLDGDFDEVEEDSSSVVAPPLPHENSAHDQDSRNFESPAARRLGEDPARAAADVVVAAVGEAAPAESSERGGRASSTSSETDSEEDATRRWEACVGRGPSAPVLRVGRR